MGGVRLSMLCVLALGGLCGLAFGGCDRTSGIYWTTDYGFDHEGSILSLPMSLLSAEKYAPHVPRIVFSDNATTDAPWADGARVLESGASAPLGCEALYLMTFEVPDDRLERLIAFVSDPNATDTADARNARSHRKSGTLHGTARVKSPSRDDLTAHGKGTNLRFYVYPALQRLGVSYALYLDIDCFVVGPVDAFFSALRRHPDVTFVVAHTSDSHTARPLGETTFASRLNYTQGADDFNDGVLGVTVSNAVDVDVPAKLAEIYAVHVSTDGPLWGQNSVNQAAMILLAKQVKTLPLDEIWNCKHLESPDCKIMHKKPNKWPELTKHERYGALRHDIGDLFAAYFGTAPGDGWKARYVDACRHIRTVFHGASQCRPASAGHPA